MKKCLLIVVLGMLVISNAAVRAAETGQDSAPKLVDGSAELSAGSQIAVYEYAIDPSAEHIYGIQYELQGKPGAKAELHGYNTYDAQGKLKQRIYSEGHPWKPLVSEAWENRRFEVMTKKGSAKLRFDFQLIGKQPVRVRNVKVVKGGFPKDPPVPEAPYLDWIASLKPNLEYAKGSPLLVFKQGGEGIWAPKERIVYVSDKEQQAMQESVAVYRALSVQALVDLMPRHRPFAFKGGFFGWTSPYKWSPTEPDLLIDKKGKPFDYLKQYPIHGYESAVAPSGKIVKYSYHDTQKDDPIHKGRRIYHAEFMATSRINSLSRAGYIMAGLYRKTNDMEYGLRSAAILWALARAMPDWAIHGQPNYDSPLSERRLQAPDYYAVFSFVFNVWSFSDAGFMLWPARYFDLIRDTPVWDELSKHMKGSDPRMDTANGLLHIGRMILKYEAYYRNSDFQLFHNMTGSSNRSVIQLGRVLGVPDMVHHGLRKVIGTFRRQFMVDGVFPESTWYTIEQVARQEEALLAVTEYKDPSGYTSSLDGTHLDIKDPTQSVPSFQRVDEALNRQTFPDGSAHTVHDTWARSVQTHMAIKFSPVREVSSYLFSAYGHGILGKGKKDNKIEAHLHYSHSGNHGHQDMLNLILWAYGDELVSDIGYSHQGQYHSSSVSHNLVIVDGSVQKGGHAGNLLSWHARKGSSQVVQADQGATPKYSQSSLYRRALILLPFTEGRNAVVDIFEVTGGNRHDWMANGSADYEQSLESTLQPKEQLDNLAADGVAIEKSLPWGDVGKVKYTRDKPDKPSIWYGAFRNAKITPMTSSWHATMKPGAPADPKAAWAGKRAKSTDPKPSLRLHWVSPLKGKAILAEAPRNRYHNELKHQKEAKKVWAKHRMPKIIVRRDGKNLESTFIAAWEPFHQKPFLGKVQSLTDVKGSGHGVLLQDDTQKKMVLYRPLESKGVLSTAGLETDGRFTITTEQKNQSSIDLYDGSSVEWGKIKADVNTTPSLLVTGVHQEKDHYVITVSGSLKEYPDNASVQPHAQEYIRFSQQDSATRWLKLARIEKGDKQSRLVLAQEPGFTFDPNGHILRETYFPHRISQGKASIMLSSWINLKWSENEKRTSILVRASGTVRLTLRDIAKGGISVQSRRASSEDPWKKLTFTREGKDLIIKLAPMTGPGEWLEVEVKG